MRPSTLLFGFIAALSSTVVAQPTSNRGAAIEAPQVAPQGRHHHRSHAHAVRRSEQNKLKKRASTAGKKKRCKAVATTSADNGAQETETATATKSSTKTRTAASASATPSDDGGSSGGGNASTGVIKVQDPTCGPNGAVPKPGEVTGPNGSLDWMNCGIAKGKNTGWTPPHVTINDLIAMTLSEALQDDNSPFKTCSKYLSTFQAAAKTYDIPDIMLASFALQESSCNPKNQGGGGEVGMFQLSEDKCPGGKASDACYDVTYNTNAAAKYIAAQLKANNGNVFAMVGNYNGWQKDMTYADATKRATSSCCLCQNNLDYLHQFCNGWMQNVDAYNIKMGKYFNLNVCSTKNNGANGRRDVPETLLKRNKPQGGWRF